MPMQTRLFEANVRRRAGLAVVDLHGDVNREADRDLNRAYDEAAAAGAARLLLNFAGVDYINSTGIAVIVGLLARARKDGRQLVICGLSEHYRTIFEITRLIDFMQVFPDEDGAVAASSAPG
jgi:anti-anti-sigma factor